MRLAFECPEAILFKPHKELMMDLDQASWIKWQDGPLPWVDAYLDRFQFSPHAHDYYAIGLTLSGVQSFDYRGETRHSLPGGAVILHPDERHDGRAGTADGFHYRTAYLEPRLVQDILGGAPLPYVEHGLSGDPKLVNALRYFLSDQPQGGDALAHECALADLIFALQDAAVKVSGGTPRLANWSAVQRVIRYIDDQFAQNLDLADLEQVAEYDRWQLSRDFRALLGTSPYRYLLMRRLQRAQARLAEGQKGAQVAAKCGFADQSHFIGHFKKAFGVTPKKWQALAG